ncbi:MAG: 50S ribosomal protein L6 [Ferroplasma sp.]
MIKWTDKMELKIPDGITVNIDDTVISIKGKLGETSRNFRDKYVKVYRKDNSLVIAVSKENKFTNGIIGTWYSELKLVFQGVTAGFKYEMKIDFTHFPMRVSVRGGNLFIENFLGGKAPRIAKIKNCKVSVKGDRVLLEGIDKRDMGDTAANIERATYIKHFDARVFQDGIYLLKGVNSDEL